MRKAKNFGFGCIIMFLSFFFFLVRFEKVSSFDGIREIGIHRKESKGYLILIPVV